MNNINWTEKVKNLDRNIRKEFGLEEDRENQILITVQVKLSEPIEPAFIVNEDDLFLDLFVLSPHDDGVISTAVLKENIQSISVIGGVSTEQFDPSEINETRFFEDATGIYQ